jgi:GntR family transcriptional regulator
MTRIGDQSDGAGASRSPPIPATVLADRIAAALIHHEPGWRLPRRSALARRYNVSIEQVGRALDALAARHLVSLLPDGQVYRASPAEYHLPLEGVGGLISHVDPMGGDLACRDRQVTRRRPPEGVISALRLADDEPVTAVRCHWTVGGEPAAVSLTYLPEKYVISAGLGAPGPADGITQWPAGPQIAGVARAVQLEVTPPPPSVSRLLRLAPGLPATAVTVRFEDGREGPAVALTTLILRPDLFRIVIRAPAAAPAAPVAASWVPGTPASAAPPPGVSVPEAPTSGTLAAGLPLPANPPGAAAPPGELLWAAGWTAAEGGWEP